VHSRTLAHASDIVEGDYDGRIRSWLLIGVSAVAGVVAMFRLIVAARIWTDYCPSSRGQVCISVVYTHGAWFYFATGLVAATISLAFLVVGIRSRRHRPTVE
jgi:hypothetical protein